ncbi:hypothetical protein HK102_011197 [Quaeritorhiza haematococci]|nr:hypothetical protein HK102_011197 [Quaeritorhiza haematococci]
MRYRAAAASVRLFDMTESEQTQPADGRSKLKGKKDRPNPHRRYVKLNLKVCPHPPETLSIFSFVLKKMLDDNLLTETRLSPEHPAEDETELKNEIKKCIEGGRSYTDIMEKDFLETKGWKIR